MKLFSAVPPVTPIKMAGILVPDRPPGMSEVSVFGSQKITPTAPAFCALVTLITKVQAPRSTRAMTPSREAAAIALQPSGSPEILPTSFKGAVKGPEGSGPPPNWPWINCRTEGTPFPVTCTPETHVCELVLPAAAMAEGASAGELTVFSVGAFWPSWPELPAATTTSMPDLTAFSTAAASGSQGVVPVWPHAEP